MVNPRELMISSTRRNALREAQKMYSVPQEIAEIERLQLRLFNDQWQSALVRHQFYRVWRDEHGLPEAVDSMSDIREFPTLTKRILRERQDLVFADSPRGKVYATGGTTAEPTVFPRSANESAFRWGDNYVGRTWWGIEPTDRSALIWGHSHLYGSGWRSRVRGAERATKDWLSGTLRLDGYRVDFESSQKHLRRVLRQRPSYIIGYSSALVRLARIASRSDIEQLQSLKLRGVIATAETLDTHDELLLRRVFGSPVILEYGAAELGVIAVSRGISRDLRVFWRSHLVMQNAGDGVLVSSLRDRQFPLINYALGDRLRVSLECSGGSILAISAIEGRVLDLLAFSGSKGLVSVSALQLTHLLKGHGGVHAVQFAQLENGRVCAYVQVEGRVKIEEVEAHFWPLFSREYPEVSRSSLTMELEPDQEHSLAGKHLVIRPVRRRDDDIR